MAFRTYSTPSRKKEPFETIEPGRDRMHVCGPAVYVQAHAGRAIPALVFDITRRYLDFRSYTVIHAKHFTGMDDKIIARANREGVDPCEPAEGYFRGYTLSDPIRGRLAGLGVNRRQQGRIIAAL
ncbi:MAG: hypothetical protein GX491_00690 [Chloroflexi bacterium]|nr:hypothetical protein [Chloroflexota bacterium]